MSSVGRGKGHVLSQHCQSNTCSEVAAVGGVAIDREVEISSAAAVGDNMSNAGASGMTSRF